MTQPHDETPNDLIRRGLATEPKVTTLVVQAHVNINGGPDADHDAVTVLVSWPERAVDWDGVLDDSGRYDDFHVACQEKALNLLRPYLNGQAYFVCEAVHVL